MEFENRDANDFFQVRSLDKYIENHKGFIAGGCFKNIFNHEKVKDIDVFFRNEEDFNEAKEYYSKSKDYSFYYSNDKVEAFIHDNGIVIECIKTVYGTPETIINNFDFTIVQFAYTCSKIDETTHYKVIYHKDFFTHLHLKRLVIDDAERQLPYIISTFNRMFRYAKYGYFPCKGTKIKVITELNLLEDVDIEELGGGLYYGFD